MDDRVHAAVSSNGESIIRVSQITPSVRPRRARWGSSPMRGWVWTRIPSSAVPLLGLVIPCRRPVPGSKTLSLTTCAFSFLGRTPSTNLENYLARRTLRSAAQQGTSGSTRRRLPDLRLAGGGDTLRALLDLLPYMKDWDDWQKEIRRLETNIVRLRKHREGRLAKILEESLPALKSALQGERVNHQFTVNRSLREMDE